MRLMTANLTLACTALVAAMTTFGAQAQTAPGSTLEKLQKTGKVVIGVRESSAPMAYAIGANHRFTGYHVELCEKVLAQIVPSAKIEYMAITAQNTMPLVQNGTVDLGCGPTTNNLSRQKQVAFAVTTYVSQVRMAVRADSPVTSFKQLDGKTVAASAGTTAVQLLRKYSHENNVKLPTQLGKDHFESFLMLESGRADAFVLDDNLLAGVIANAKDPKGYKIVGEALGSEPIALLMRKDDPGFKKAVDDALVRMMKSGEVAKIYDKWFMQPIPPKEMPLNLPMSETLKQLLQAPNDKPLEAYNS
ncbi:transporter substrate-binding domain-containing protein [Comamonas testosteroni]|uniref:Extracellular solute-binding protein family 3 n=1 Tax=Comamonas testosteroni (strain DSM 14576 / KF-1) TaxID=399795 RepID=B7WW69_COMTK|nr:MULTISPECIES: transporter substrate-binding domain-containing protein [Comamonas]EED69552.1 extracellular solute-binding protein family 3 [Comamonas testosteroni KF-1]TYK72222.1 amino acid ABC transporter substrate-binding protein [Comamonas sp. Z3]WQG67518.1 transporter substrate-binding domain-containing protein [Comamonas testosteroni]